MKLHSWYSSCLSTADESTSHHSCPTNGNMPVSCITHQRALRVHAQKERLCGHSVCSVYARARRSMSSSSRDAGAAALASSFGRGVNDSSD